MSTITVRVIKSFEYRTIKNIVFHHLDLDTLTFANLLDMVHKYVKENGGFRPYRNVNLDSLKIYWHPHLTKTMDLAINLDHPDWIIKDFSQTLASVGCVNETEVSCFNMELYKEYEANPVNKWD